MLPRPSSPAAAWRDLKTFLGERGRYKYVIGLISIAMPALIVTAFYFDANIKPSIRIIYVQQWPANRTIEQIKADQKIDQAKRDAAAAERKREYKALADRLGIDTK